MTNTTRDLTGSPWHIHSRHMAQVQSPTSLKRGPGRPPKALQPALKKTRISTSRQPQLALSTQSPPAVRSPNEKTSNKLPYRISNHRPLPTLSEPQAAPLPSSEYQSIASSAVLQSSLDRSRLKWVNDGVFERYWVKPETGKNARPAPPNNPELKWQKHKGPCRIRIEPHIFEVEMYVEEKVKPQSVKQYIPPQSTYGQVRAGQQMYGQQQQHHYNQNRFLPPVQQQTMHAHPHGHSPMLGMVQSPHSSTIAQHDGQQSSSQPLGQDKKKADPVISMLAERASSDPRLKSLMKEVATGNATQIQLRIFQSHIDELTKVINVKKTEDEEAAVKATRERQQRAEMIQYDGACDNAPSQAQSMQPPYIQQLPSCPNQPSWQPRPPPQPVGPQPVILQFTAPGASEDRFLFPPNSILEPLSPQHLLVSFLAIRRGAQAADSTGLHPSTEYWQPITFMVEVAYNREHLIECVKLWVRPAEEVRMYMKDIMDRCVRAPEESLALRLPLKGTVLAAEPEEVLGSGGEEATPLVPLEKTKRNVKFVKKAVEKKDEAGKAVNSEGQLETISAQAQTPVTEDYKDGKGTEPGDEGGGEEPETMESGRPRRAIRKSVRISDV